MAGLIATLAAVFLFGLTGLAAEDKDTCDIFAAVGQNALLPFSYEKMTNSQALRWTHNNTIVFHKHQGRVSLGRSDDVSATGSLTVRNVKFSSAGAYHANVLQPNGTLAESWSSRLCVKDKVPKPQVRYRCDFKLGAVILECVTPGSEELGFSWQLDKKTLPGEAGPTLRVGLSQLTGGRSFSCSVSNRASQDSSDAVRPSCQSPPPPPLLCFTSNTVTGAAAGGAALILLLIIIIIVLCCCRRRGRTVGGKGELRMLSMNRRELDCSGPEYETMHPTETCPPPNPRPSPRAHYSNVSVSETENKAEGERPSPVPKPRTKNPQTANLKVPSSLSTPGTSRH